MCSFSKKVRVVAKLNFQLIILILVLNFFQSCRNSKDRYEYYIKKALQYERSGELDEALKHINNAILIDSTKAFAFICRGIIKSDQKNEISAMADFSKSIQIDKKNTAAYFQKALSFSRLNLDDSAIKYFNLAIDTKRYGDYYIEETYNKNLAFQTQIIPMEIIRYNRALSYYSLEKDSLAFEDFYYSMLHNYQKGSSYYYMGAISISIGRNGQGCKYLQEAVKNGENDAIKYLDKYCK